MRGWRIIGGNPYESVRMGWTAVHGLNALVVDWIQTDLPGGMEDSTIPGQQSNMGDTIAVLRKKSQMTSLPGLGVFRFITKWGKAVLLRSVPWQGHSHRAPKDLDQTRTIYPETTAAAP
jgi:hypothetical protein